MVLAAWQPELALSGHWAWPLCGRLTVALMTMPRPQLSEKGVFVMTGTDSVYDQWSPFDRADMLEKANL
ncbi:hypothetical protein [Bosea sp. (in: a-proteobacteria)]|jgi:hypothetical protein|uniref:hypothetical protein n=1 Tax=Bosea sp. (in: a-proteobacteria) TaxID=1871050 RepID=UPI0035630470